MPRPLRIALLIGASRQYRRDLLGGIADYARVHGPWAFYHEEQMLADQVPAWFENWQGDGILARIESPRQIEAIRRKRLPTVDLLGLHQVEGFGTFDNDSEAVAQLGADHLLERGFEHFAFCGLLGVHYSDHTGERFAEYLRQKEYEVHVYDDPSPGAVAASVAEERGLLREDELADWLVSLPKPLGLMACNDLRAQQVLNACAQREIAVPDEVAVLGADNDEVLCGLSNPPLSSIEPNARRMGFEGAALLERMIHGEAPPAEKTLIAPGGVVTRRSTDVLAISDRSVAAAVRYIREHATSGIRVEDVLGKLRLSRSTLERRFAKSLGRSPKAEILRVQLRRVKQFLAETDYPLAKIARLTGFNHVENMCNYFKAKTGRTPGQFRRETRPPQAAGLREKANSPDAIDH